MVVDLRRDKSIDPPPPRVTRSGLGKDVCGKGRSIAEWLRDFSCNATVEFDALLPMFVPSKGRRFELGCGSSGNVDIFVAALPVKEMYELYADIHSRGKEESAHNYLWMLRWLDACMELSSISRPMLRARLKCYTKGLPELRQIIDEHIECFEKMCVDDAIDFQVLEKHVQEGRQKERTHNLIVALTVAIDVVDMVADQIQHPSTWQPCVCSNCETYKLKGWLESLPLDVQLEHSREPFLLRTEASYLYIGDYARGRRFDTHYIP